MKLVLFIMLLFATFSIASDTDTLPNWVLNPDTDGLVCDVGSADFQNSLQQTKKASFITAKANISKQISIWVNTQSKSYQDSTGKNDFSTQSKQISVNMLENTFIKDELYDKQYNRYYTRVCTQKK